jgi:hypothetical protein
LNFAICVSAAAIAHGPTLMLCFGPIVSGLRLAKPYLDVFCDAKQVATDTRLMYPNLDAESSSLSWRLQQRG